MHDVLPKPFTKEGLITMLDKHLSHLKKHPQTSLSPMGAPPPPTGVVSKRALKTEESPATSPATTNNWHSPHQFSSGVSPAGTPNDEAGFYGQGAFPGQQNLAPTPPLYNSAPGAAIGTPQRPLQPNPSPRRGISNVSGGQPEMGDAKRQQMYAPSAAMGQAPLQPMPRQSR